MNTCTNNTQANTSASTNNTQANAKEEMNMNAQVNNTNAQANNNDSMEVMNMNTQVNTNAQANNNYCDITTGEVFNTDAIDAAKVFAEAQFSIGLYPINFECNNTHINNPWYDETGRFEHDLYAAYRMYGTINMDNFIKRASEAVHDVIEFANRQFEEGTDDISFVHEGMCINNPWYDETGRFELTTKEAITKYGIDNMLMFIITAYEDLINMKDEEDAFSYEALNCWSHSDLAEYVRDYLDIDNADEWGYGDLIDAIYTYNHE